MADTIRIDVDARGVATITLDRPEKHNVISGQMMADLSDAAKRLGKDPAVRVVVLTGAGKSFCAGGDLNWMKEQMQGSAADRAAQATKLAMTLQALNTLSKPLIGRIQGNAFGGGVGFACVCDIAIGVRGAQFGLTETKLGLIPATIGPYVLARLGESMARRVFMSSRRFGADEAVTLGVIAKAVDPDDLDAAVDDEIEPYLSCAPGAVASAKALARRLGPPINEAVIAETIDALVARWETDEAREGIAAFFEKRTPGWAQE